MTSTDMQSPLMSEKLALFLALFGYVPFFTLALAVGPLNPTLALWISAFALPAWFFAHVLTVYGAVILSFLGGIRWGVAMVGSGPQTLRRTELIWSVVTSLIGWAAVFLPRAEGLYLLAISFAAHGLWDFKLVASGRAPHWFSKLRIILTVLVSVTLLVAGYWST